MLRRSLLLALSLAALASTAAAQRVDPIRRLEVWTERRRRADDALEPGVMEQLRGLLLELGRYEAEAPHRRPDVVTALLGLAALDTAEAQVEGVRRRTPGSMGRRELNRRLDRASEDVGPLVAAPLADPGHDSDERVAAANVLSGRYVKGTLGPLLVAARDPTDGVRHAAQDALAGWPDAGLHEFFLDELEGGTGSLRAVQDHFERTRDRLGDRTLGRMRDALGRMLFSSDWRQAARARRLVPILDARRAVPLLIEGLRLWNRRLEDGSGSLRIRHEIVQELRRISGRSIGPRAEHWETWWRRVGDGSIELPEDADPDAYTSASFFGLQVVSNRVLFVLDRSGSMDTSFGTGGHTRYEEAVLQLLNYLAASGPDTRFGVVLFSDNPVRWRTEMRAASDSNRDKLERWLGSKRADGGTRLRKAVFEAVRYKRGRLLLDRLEADTVVVLCDGETSVGPGWVRPWLDAINDEAQLVFHCVQVGSDGDGTLEQLARLTGGDHVEVQG